MKKNTLLAIVLVFISLNSYSQVIDEFRSLDRTGVFNETNLLKEWPLDGPEMLWSLENIPVGHSSISSAYNTLYLTGPLVLMI